jgi:hypothetical protein
MRTHPLSKARRRHYRRKARALARLAPGQARDCLRASLHDRAARESAEAVARTVRRLRRLIALPRIALDLLHGARRVLVVSPGGPIKGHHATGIDVDEVDDG